MANIQLAVFLSVFSDLVNILPLTHTPYSMKKMGIRMQKQIIIALLHTHAILKSGFRVTAIADRNDYLRFILLNPRKLHKKARSIRR